MFQWDAVDTSPDLESQNVIKTFEMAIRHDRRTIRTKLERVFCRWTTVRRELTVKILGQGLGLGLARTVTSSILGRRQFVFLVTGVDELMTMMGCDCYGICSCSSSFGLRSAVQHEAMAYGMLPCRPAAAAATAVDMSVMYRLQ